MAEFRSDAYTNPTFAVDKSYEIMAKQRKEFTKSFTESMTASARYVTAERDKNKALRDKQVATELAQYSKIEGLKEVGVDYFDKSKDDLFYGLADNYVELSRMQEEGNYTEDYPDSQSINRALAKINGKVGKYQKLAPSILSITKELNDAMKISEGEQGALYSQNSTPQMEMLMIMAGQVDGEVSLRETSNGDGFELYNEETGDVLNASELANYTDSGHEYFKTVDLEGADDLLKTAFDGVMTEDSLKDLGLTDYKKIKKDGYEQTVGVLKEDQYNAVVDRLVTSGGYDVIIDDDDMDVTWNDILKQESLWGMKMVDGEKVPMTTDEQEAQKKEAKVLLAKKSFKDNSPGFNLDEDGNWYNYSNVSETPKTKILESDQEYADLGKDVSAYVEDLDAAIGMGDANRNNAVRNVLNSVTGLSLMTRDEIQIASQEAIASETTKKESIESKIASGDGDTVELKEELEEVKESIKVWESSMKTITSSGGENDFYRRTSVGKYEPIFRFSGKYYRAGFTAYQNQIISYIASALGIRKSDAKKYLKQ